MNKILISSVVSILMLFNVFGQNNVRVSEPYLLEGGTRMFYYHDGILLGRSNTHGDTPEGLYRYVDNGTFDFNGETDVFVPDNGIGNEFVELQRGNHVYVLHQKGGYGEEKIYKTTFSIEEGKVGETIEIARLTDMQYSMYNKSIETYVSRDSSLILVTYKHKPKVVNNNINKDLYECILLSDELEVLTRWSYEVPYVESSTQNLGFCVNEDGRVFNMLFTNTEGDAGLKLVTLKDENEQEVYNVTWNFENIVPRKVLIKENAIGGVVFSGLYADNVNVEDGYDGVFGIHLSEDGSITQEFKHEFSNELLMKGKETKVIERLKKQVEKGDNLYEYALSIHEIKVHDDNSMTFVCEYISHGDYSYYKDVIICQSTPSNELGWMYKIVKNQSAADFGFDFDVNRLNLYYLDHVANEERKEGDPLARYTYSSYAGNLVWVTLDLESGQAMEEVVFNMKTVRDKGVKANSPGSMIKLGEGKYALEAALKKGYNVLLTITKDE